MSSGECKPGMQAEAIAKTAHDDTHIEGYTTMDIRSAGKLERGVMLAMMGDRGSGKTTTAAMLPKPLVFAIEDGTQALAEFGTSVVDLPPIKGKPYREVILESLREVAKTNYRTVVLDSATTMLDRMIEDLVRNEAPHARSLAAALGGYMKARDVLVREVADIVEACLWLCRKRRMHVCWIMHQKLRTVSLPDREDYERIIPQGQADAIDTICNPCDVVCLVEQTMQTIKQGEKVTVRGDGSRQIVIGPHPALAIKSRFDKKLRRIPVVIGENPLVHAVAD